MCPNSIVSILLSNALFQFTILVERKNETYNAILFDIKHKHNSHEDNERMRMEWGWNSFIISVMF